MKTTRPSFRTPPVVETVLGVEFAPIDRWGIPHFGLFWHQIRRAFPNYEIQPPLTSQIESFDAVPKSQVSRFELVTQLEARCWYISEDDHQLVQVQRDRFLFNWRKADSEVEYPRYDEFVRPAFERNWQAFVDFLAMESLGTVEVVQCEVTYVNHIPKGDGWTNVGDWSEVFPLLSGRWATEFLPSPEVALFNLNFLIPDRKGRLRVSANHAIRRSDGREIIALTLTARGRPDSPQLSDVLGWIDLGREWVVRGFTDITSKKMHELWQRET